MSTVQNFIQKKKKKQRKEKSRKRQKVGHGREKGNFVQHTLPPFLPILERLNCGGPREKMAGPYHFSLPLPFSSKHPSHPFSLLFSTFFFPSSLKSTHPNIMLVSVSLSLFIWRLKANESLSLWDFIWLLSFILSLY